MCPIISIVYPIVIWSWHVHKDATRSINSVIHGPRLAELAYKLLRDVARGVYECTRYTPDDTCLDEEGENS
jgi:hypothetical protein